MEQQSGYYEFGAFSLYPGRREVKRGDIVVTMDAEAMDVLLYLLMSDNQTASYEDVVAILPAHSAARLDRAITNLRRALDDTPGQPSVIQKSEDGMYQLAVDSTLFAAQGTALLEQPRPRPAGWVYAALLGGMLVLLGLAVTLIPPM